MLFTLKVYQLSAPAFVGELSLGAPAVTFPVVCQFTLDYNGPRSFFFIYLFNRRQSSIYFAQNDQNRPEVSILLEH